MAIELFIKEKAPTLGHRILIAPNIPKEKLNACTLHIADDISGDYILIFADATLWGKGAIGFAFSGSTLYYANDKGKKNYILLKDILKAKYLPKKLGRLDTMYELGDKIVIETRNGGKVFLEGCLIGFNCKSLENIFNGIVELINKGEKAISTRQNVTLAEMPESAKLAYLKLLCNYAYLSDGVINSDEFSAIQNIIVRMELYSDSRIKLREYMTSMDQKEKSGNLIYAIRNEIESGSFDILRYSLLQDVLYLHGISFPNKPWYEDGFIGSLIDTLNISPDKLKVMEEAIEVNNAITGDDAELYTIKDKTKSLVKEAVKLNIPLVTMYCSGSPYNIDVYHKIFKNSNQIQVSIDKQRELMLQAVIKNSQKTLNNLVDDMNNISQQLVDEVKKGETATSQIEKLSEILSKLSAGATRTVEKSEDVEQRILYSQLPTVLDMCIFPQLYKGESNKEKCEYIYKIYPINEMTNKRGIRRDLSIDELNKVIRIMEEIDYPMKGANANE